MANAAADSQHCSDKKSLQKEIKALIAPYRSDEDEEPPFTESELLVMAVLSHKKDAVSTEEALRWIFRNFAYYRDFVIEEYAFIKQWEDTSEPLRMVIPGFHDALDDCDVPLQDLDHKNVIRSWYPRDWGVYSNVVTVPPAAGRIFLHHRLEPKRAGVFKFLELPPELRNRIYELVFCLPESGVSVGHCKSQQIELWERSSRELERKAGCQHRDRSELRIKGPPLQKLLALLTVNKQIYKESMPVFYQLTDFHFQFMKGLSSFVQGTAPTRLSQLRHVYIEYYTYLHWPSCRSSLPAREAFTNFQSALAILAEHVWLDKFSLLIDEDFCFNIPDKIREACGHNPGPYTEIEEIPGMRSIAVIASRAKEYEFYRHGPEKGEFLKYPRFEDYVEQYVRKVRATEAAEMESKEAAEMDGRDDVEMESGETAEVESKDAAEMQHSEAAKMDSKLSRFKMWWLTLRVRRTSAWRWRRKGH